MHDSRKREIGTTGAQTDPSHALAAMELLSPYSLWSLSEWLGKGASKYAPRNWEQGIKFSICIGKLQRHLQEYLMGKTNEDHWAAVGFWWHALAHYEKMIKLGLLSAELDDLPKYEQKKYPEPLINKLKPLMEENESTIELVPSKGWQIRLANGKFLVITHLLNGTNYHEFTAPYYYDTKEAAQNIVADYLNYLKYSKENRS